MRLILDTNVVVAALLYHGSPNRLLQTVVDGRASCVSSPLLLAELRRVLHYPQLARRIALLAVEPAILAERYEHVAELVDSPDIPRTVPTDPDDDHVLACALAARADLIVSGDKDLLSLGSFEGIRIVSPAIALERVLTTSR